MAQWAKNPPTMQETQDTRVRFLDQEVPPENLATWQPALYSRLKNPMDRVAWRAVVPGVTKSWTLVSKRTHTHIHRVLHFHGSNICIICFFYLLVKHSFLTPDQLKNCSYFLCFLKKYIFKTL